MKYREPDYVGSDVYLGVSSSEQGDVRPNLAIKMMSTLEMDKSLKDDGMLIETNYENSVVASSAVPPTSLLTDDMDDAGAE